MKKIIMGATAIMALGLTSCSTTSITHTASTESIPTEIYGTRNTAELKVSEHKVTYKFVPDGNYKNVRTDAAKKAAVAKALEANGNADVLVAPEYEIKHKNSKIEYVIVKGYPATFRNIHPISMQEVEIETALSKIKRHK